jgi:hypothetical protein
MTTSLAWQFTEDGGRIVGGLVVIGGNAAGDGATVAVIIQQ